jgi:hypothetical protein
MLHLDFWEHNMISASGRGEMLALFESLMNGEHKKLTMTSLLMDKTFPKYFILLREFTPA